MKASACPIFPVKSGIPVIGLGLLIILMPVVAYLLGGFTVMPWPVMLVFVGFGTYLIWLGFKK